MAKRLFVRGSMDGVVADMMPVSEQYYRTVEHEIYHMVKFGMHAQAYTRLMVAGHEVPSASEVAAAALKALGLLTDGT